MDVALKPKRKLSRQQVLLRENAALKDKIRLLEAVIDNFPGGIVLTDKDLNILICNRQQRSLLQYPEHLFASNLTLEDLFRFNAKRGEYGPGEVEEIVAGKMALAAKAEAHAFERTRPNGQVVEIRGTPLPGGGFVTSYIDVTENRAMQKGVAELALKDSLTGLANRPLFLDRLKQAIALARRGDHFALHYIDLDNFKPINDQHGHDAGDEVLREISRRFKRVARETDMVARLGGDEFVVIQTKASSVEAAEKLAVRLLQATQQPIVYGGHNLMVGASIGISMSMHSVLESDQMVKFADLALYESKRRGKNRFRIFGAGPQSDPT
ncbi:diguanylate cyclase domain-containing protein [Aestuariivirga sp.]|uniref:diguanylate cyclase domain-containing protein n=1 Tax=Aestuariivirga sp. TaxID=2650926 RepID=UPI0039E46BD7